MPKHPPSLVRGRGRPGDDPAIKEARRITKAQFLDIMTEYLTMRVDTLTDIVKTKEKPVLHILVGQIALTAIKNADERKLAFFMDRLIGPVPKEVPDVNINMNVQSMPPEKVIDLAKDAIKFLEDSDEKA